MNYSGLCLRRYSLWPSPFHVPDVIRSRWSLSCLQSFRPESVVSVEFEVAVTFAAVPVVFWLSVGTSADTSARNVGATAEPDDGPARTVFAVCVKAVAVTVPLVVTAVEGVLLSIIPSPVKVTEVTVPLPDTAAQLG